MCKCWPSKSRSRSLSTIFAMTRFDRQISKPANDSHTFLCIIFPFQRNKITFYLKKADQSHVVKCSQRIYSMGNVKIDNVSYTCSLTFLHFQSYNNFKLWASKIRSSLLSTIFVMTPFYGKFQNTEMYHKHFYAISYCFK